MPKNSSSLSCLSSVPGGDSDRGKTVLNEQKPFLGYHLVYRLLGKTRATTTTRMGDKEEITLYTGC